MAQLIRRLTKFWLKSLLLYYDPFQILNKVTLMVDELDNMTWWVQQIRDGSFSTPLDSRDLVRDYTDVVTQLQHEVPSLLIYSHY